jgi:hypothetical protein
VQDEQATGSVCMRDNMAYLSCVHVYKIPSLHRQGEADFRAAEIATHVASPTHGDYRSNVVSVFVWPNCSIGDLTASEVALKLAHFVFGKIGALGRDVVEMCFSRVIARRIHCSIESTHFFFDGDELLAEDLVSLCMFWISVTLCVLCDHMRVWAVAYRCPISTRSYPTQVSLYCFV